MERHYYKCKCCLSVVASCEYLRQAKCQLCDGDFEYMGQVRKDRLVKVGLETPCDCRCTNARGPICNCKCGGCNHGSGLLVLVTRDSGPVPILHTPDSVKAKRIASEWKAATAATLKAIHALQEKKDCNGWLAPDDFREYRRLSNALNAARKMKLHKNRMDRLGALVDISDLMPAATVSDFEFSPLPVATLCCKQNTLF